MAANKGAQAFWRKVVGRYTDGRFEEVQRNNARWVLFFDNGPRHATHAGEEARPPQRSTLPSSTA